MTSNDILMVLLGAFGFLVYCLGLMGIFRRIDEMRAEKRNPVVTDWVGRAWFIGYNVAWLVLLLRFCGEPVT